MCVLLNIRYCGPSSITSNRLTEMLFARLLLQPLKPAHSMPNLLIELTKRTTSYTHNFLTSTINIKANQIDKSNCHGD